MSEKNFRTFYEYMKQTPLSASEEDYIEMIYRLNQGNKILRVNDIVRALNVKASSASNMLKKLAAKGYIIHAGYRPFTFTEAGRKIGKILYERHDTIDRFLRFINKDDNNLEDVERIEHTISLKTVNSLKKLVNFFDENQDIAQRFTAYTPSEDNQF